MLLQTSPPCKSGITLAVPHHCAAGGNIDAVRDHHLRDLGAVLTVTLNRPEKLNAFTGVMAAELIDAFDRADADDDVRAVIVTGAGRAFCAGADLSAGAASFDRLARADRVAPPLTPDGEPDLSHEAARDGGGRVSLRIFSCLKPVIAAVNGPAVGVGVTMLLPMDIRLASQDARFGFVFARRGIVPEACSSWFLPRIVGIARALEWTYTGRVFPASEALAGGLVSAVHPRRLARLPARSRRAPPPSPSRSPAKCCGGCWAPRIPWRPIGSKAAPSSRAA